MIIALLITAYVLLLGLVAKRRQFWVGHQPCPEAEATAAFALGLVAAPWWPLLTLAAIAVMVEQAGMELWRNPVK
jgi:hypothetical protein